MQPEAIVERLWPGADARVEPLGGGITNRNFKVEVGDEAFVLRIGGKDTELLGIDRRAEHAASLAAAAAGVGPGVVGFVEPEGYLVTRFVPGQPMDGARTAEVAELLRRIHCGPELPSRFDAHEVVEAYRATAAVHGVDVPTAYADAKAIADAIEAARGPQPRVPCHNDLLNANFIDTGAGLCIVDWEYAGMGDRFFDLANFAVNHELDQAGDRELLAAYFGEVREHDERGLVLMRFMSDFREAMWGVVQQGISELDFDFAGYAGQHFERLEATAASDRFREALK
jgi:thiamine kinase-like enzyme